MSTPLRREGQADSPASSLGHFDPDVGPIGRRPTSQEEIAGRARERTNAHGSPTVPVSGRERIGYASRELERLARGLAEQAIGLREHGEESAAERLDRTAEEMRALAQAMAASRRA